MHYLNSTVLSAANTGSQTGAKIDSQMFVSISFQAVNNDGVAAGSIQIQASNDINNDNYQANAFTPTHWTNISGATATMAAGASGLVTIANCAYRWMRVVYTSVTPGTTTIQVNIQAIYP